MKKVIHNEQKKKNYYTENLTDVMVKQNGRESYQTHANPVQK